MHSRCTLQISLSCGEKLHLPHPLFPIPCQFMHGNAYFSRTIKLFYYCKKCIPLKACPKISCIKWQLKKDISNYLRRYAFKGLECKYGGQNIITKVHLFYKALQASAEIIAVSIADIRVICGRIKSVLIIFCLMKKSWNNSNAENFLHNFHCVYGCKVSC